MNWNLAHKSEPTQETRLNVQQLQQVELTFRIDGVVITYKISKALNAGSLYVMIFDSRAECTDTKESLFERLRTQAITALKNFKLTDS